MFESVVIRKYNSFFSVPFSTALDTILIFLAFSAVAMVMPGIYFNFIVSLFCQDFENLCFKIFIFTYFGDIRQCFIPCTFFEKKLFDVFTCSLRVKLN